MKKIKVLVVDDSALMRKIISDMIKEDSSIEVIGTARNGQDLMDKFSSSFYKTMPDVITMDVEMPKMDGITALGELKKKNIDIPVIILSSISKEGTKLTMECLAAGAFDFLPKPSGTISLDIDKVKVELIQKIKVAYFGTSNKNSPIKTISAAEDKSYKEIAAVHIAAENTKKVRESKFRPGRIDAVVMGASTGGPKALTSVITELPKDIGVPVFVVQHMPVGFTKAFAERLNLSSHVKVVEAQEGMTAEINVVYIAPGGYHMEVWNDKKIHLNKEPAIWGVRPAVDKLFVSASKVYKENIVSVVLTGMGKDGAEGTVEIKKNGGITISQDESTCTIYGMPKVAYETGKVDLVLPLNDIAKEVLKIITSGRR
ncbi:protein-glutamate methylesterase/protein-glutamine glutaminase [Clostridium kluyveri]|uniref:Protein-glutamate methylesterase/protein-glutamine glutaminase n=1 Tax=Clostridium kluyveri TaxID=1534 RepID=A0A1L5F8H4_CLOKL|nr:chemotaxis response regulator protein-glutamate methylesterase [Clostridium kluyveri]APM39314.1 chemotaxis response regulator protein-glutamate methylesterase [Clostridium kluyveri]